MATGFLHFTPCGLIFDVAGVVLLGFAFFLKTTESMIEESGTTWDSKAYVTIVENRSDGIFGTTLLSLGFVYQTLGYAGVESTAAVLASYAALILFSRTAHFCEGHLSESGSVTSRPSLVKSSPNNALVNDACGRRSRAFFSASQRGRWASKQETW